MKTSIAIPRTVLPVLLLFLPLPSLAQDEQVSIDDFAFLTGYWQGTGLGGQAEEMWMPPAGGRMFGIYKQNDASGELQFSEYLEIVQVDGQFVLRLKHFNPDFSGWESADEYVTFPFEEVLPGSARFRGLSYSLQDDGSLSIALDLFDSSGDKRTEIISLHRADSSN